MDEWSIWNVQSKRSATVCTYTIHTGLRKYIKDSTLKFLFPVAGYVKDICFFKF